MLNFKNNFENQLRNLASTEQGQYQVPESDQKSMLHKRNFEQAHLGKPQNDFMMENFQGQLASNMFKPEQP